jgi:hypothetical protein
MRWRASISRRVMPRSIRPITWRLIPDRRARTSWVHLRRWREARTSPPIWTRCSRARRSASTASSERRPRLTIRCLRSCAPHDLLRRLTGDYLAVGRLARGRRAVCHEPGLGGQGHTPLALNGARRISQPAAVLADPKAARCASSARAQAQAQPASRAQRARPPAGANPPAGALRPLARPHQPNSDAAALSRDGTPRRSESKRGTTARTWPSNACLISSR